MEEMGIEFVLGGRNTLDSKQVDIGDDLGKSESFYSYSLQSLVIGAQVSEPSSRLK